MRYLVMAVLATGLLAGCETGPAGPGEFSASTGAAGGAVPSDETQWIGPGGGSEGADERLDICQAEAQARRTQGDLGMDSMRECMEAGGFTQV